MLIYNSPQPFWHQGPVSWNTVFPRTGGEVEDASGSNERDGEQWGAADEALLACPPLTSCCAARFLTGCGPVPVRVPGVWDP